MSTVNEVKRLRALCEDCELEGREILAKYTDEDLAAIFNGIGPEAFPSWLRTALDALHPSLAPVALIHDVEWSESDGTKESFTASNKRFKRNGSKVAKAEYAWYNPRRYAVMNSARRFGNICQTFGWAAWMAPFTAKDVEEQKANAPRVAARFAAGLRPGGYSVMLSAMKNGGGAEAVE